MSHTFVESSIIPFPSLSRMSLHRVQRTVRRLVSSSNVFLKLDTVKFSSQNIDDIPVLKYNSSFLKEYKKTFIMFCDGDGDM